MRCRKCFSKDKRILTRHHVLPKRHFGGEGILICLCRRCHDEIEKLIPLELQDEIFYYYIVCSFLEAKSGDYQRSSVRQVQRKARSSKRRVHS